jgi:hypothetical protein
VVVLSPRVRRLLPYRRGFPRSTRPAARPAAEKKRRITDAPPGRFSKRAEGRRMREQARGQAKARSALRPTRRQKQMGAACRFLPGRLVSLRPRALPLIPWPRVGWRRTTQAVVWCCCGLLRVGAGGCNEGCCTRGGEPRTRMEHQGRLRRHARGCCAREGRRPFTDTHARAPRHERSHTCLSPPTCVVVSPRRAPPPANVWFLRVSVVLSFYESVRLNGEPSIGATDG